MKKSIKATIATLIIGVIACGGANSVNATLIGPGGTVMPVPVTLFPPPGIFVTSMSQAFDNGFISGTLNSYVYSGGSLGGYTFVYQISMTAPGHTPDSVSDLATGHFGSFSVDVSQALVVAGSPQPVSQVSRSAGTGAVLNWQFVALSGGGLGTLDPGQDSFYLIAATDATTYQTALVGIIDTQTVNVLSFVPDVPDGGSAVALLGIALVGIEGVRRMFRARKA